MLNSLKIENFRSFENYEMRDLGRINLIVGKNNSGKTSVLEALHLVASQGNENALWQILSQRSEYIEILENNSV